MLRPNSEQMVKRYLDPISTASLGIRGIAEVLDEMGCLDAEGEAGAYSPLRDNPFLRGCLEGAVIILGTFAMEKSESLKELIMEGDHEKRQSP